MLFGGRRGAPDSANHDTTTTNFVVKQEPHDSNAVAREIVKFAIGKQTTPFVFQLNQHLCRKCLQYCHKYSKEAQEGKDNCHASMVSPISFGEISLAAFYSIFSLVGAYFNSNTNYTSLQSLGMVFGFGPLVYQYFNGTKVCSNCKKRGSPSCNKGCHDFTDQ